jgi:hypothetical protein
MKTTLNFLPKEAFVHQSSSSLGKEKNENFLCSPPPQKTTNLKEAGLLTTSQKRKKYVRLSTPHKNHV